MWPNASTFACMGWALLCALTIRPIAPMYGMVFAGAVIITLILR